MSRVERLPKHLTHILKRLRDVRESGDGWTACCPAHDDRKPSLVVSLGDEGRALLHCHAGCDLEDILDKLGLQPRDLFAKGGQRIVATFDYTDERGAPLYQTVRYAPKDFRQRRPDPDAPGEWIANTKSVRRVLYRLPALKGQKRVFIVEGEKDADRLAALGQPATTNVGGAGKWRDEYTEQLKAAGVEQVVIIPDNDEPGETHARKVAQSCLHAGLRVKIVRLPDLPPKGDVSDWLDEGYKLGDLLADVSATPEEVSTDGLDVVRMSEVEAERVDWFWPGRIPLGMLTLLVGDPEAGKSFLTLDLAARLSRGREWPDGDRAPVGTSIFVAAEDSAAKVIRPRLDALGADVSKILLIRATRIEGREQMFSLTRDLEHLRRLIDTEGARLIIVDPVNAYLGGKVDSFKDPDVRSVLTPLAQLAEQTNTAIVGIMHMNKDTQRSVLYRASGSIAFTAVPRAIHFVARDKDNPDRRLLTNAKLSIARRASTLAFQITDTLRVEWETEPVDISAEDAIREDDEHALTQIAQATAWLRVHLDDEGGSAPAETVVQAALERGFSERTLRRAKARLRVLSDRTPKEKGTLGPWVWRLPPEKRGRDEIPREGESGHVGNVGNLAQVAQVAKPTGATRAKTKTARRERTVA
jgi:archaellum biogenesis ATPase FlaH